MMCFECKYCHSYEDRSKYCYNRKIHAVPRTVYICTNKQIHGQPFNPEKENNCLYAEKKENKA